MSDAIPVSEDLTLGRVNATPEVRETPGCSQIPCNVPTALGWGDVMLCMTRPGQLKVGWGFHGFLMVRA